MTGPSPPGPETLGVSREGRPIAGWRIGRGATRISLIAGCHADEPIGPWTLHRLVRHLAALPDDHPHRADRTWWIVPDANPDGAARNTAWTARLPAAPDPVAYLRGAVRELPGDDVEFGFPRDADDAGARPENRALAAWWRSADGPFALHASLHGMSVARGVLFLVEPAWRDRCAAWMEACRGAVAELGLPLLHIDRQGEKGFAYVGPGFATRPDSRAMAAHFRARGDEATAARFRPSSMETVRALGGDPLTIVSEVPLFLLPPRPPGSPPAGPDELDADRTLVADWRRRIAQGEDETRVRAALAAAGVRAIPPADQTRLQGRMVLAAVREVEGAGSRTRLRN